MNIFAKFCIRGLDWLIKWWSHVVEPTLNPRGKFQNPELHIFWFIPSHSDKRAIYWNCQTWSFFWECWCFWDICICYKPSWCSCLFLVEILASFENLFHPLQHGRNWMCRNLEYNPLDSFMENFFTILLGSWRVRRSDTPRKRRITNIILWETKSQTEHFSFILSLQHWTKTIALTHKNFFHWNTAWDLVITSHRDGHYYGLS